MCKSENLGSPNYELKQLHFDDQPKIFKTIYLFCMVTILHLNNKIKIFN